MAIIYERGTIAHIGAINSRTSQSTGNVYNSRQLVINCQGANNSLRPVALEVGNSRINDTMMYKVGDKVEVGYIVSSREWNGKWYTQADFINIKPVAATTSPQNPPAPEQHLQDDLNDDPNIPDFLKDNGGE